MKEELKVSLGFPRSVALHCPKCGFGTRHDNIVFDLEEPTRSKKVRPDRALIRGSRTYRCYHCNTMLKRETVVAFYIKEAK